MGKPGGIGGRNYQERRKSDFVMDDGIGDGIGWSAKWTFVVLLAGGLAILFVALAFAYFQPYFVHQQTYAAKNSYGYTTTKQEQLVALVQDYQKLDAQITQDKRDPSNAAIVAGLQANQKADLDRLRSDSALMNQRDIPPTVAQFLAEHSGE